MAKQNRLMTQGIFERCKSNRHAAFFRLNLVYIYLRRRLYLVTALFLSLIFGLTLSVYANGQISPAAAEQCPNALFVIPSSGELGWTYMYPDAYELCDDEHPRIHTGIDISGSTSDEIYAAYGGKVRQATLPRVSIIHEDLGVETYYSHLSSIASDIQPGKQVSRGQKIGMKGSVGTNLVHLHFSVKNIGQRELCIENTHDPSSFLGANVNYQKGSEAWDGKTVKDLCIGSDSNNVDTALIIDSTGSMEWNDPNGLRKEGAKAFIDSVSTGDRVAVISFDSVAEVLQSIRRIQTDNDRDILKSAVDQVDSYGLTDLNAGLNAGFSQLASVSNNGNSKAAVLLTDGKQEQSGPYDPQSHLQYALNLWPVYTIGLGSETDEHLLQQMALETEGEYIHLSEAQDLKEVYFRIAGTVLGNNVVHTSNHWLRQGETKQQYANLQPGQSSATFYTGWSGSEVETTLVSPTGRIITPSTNSLDVRFASSDTYKIFTVQNPQEGQWTVILYGVSLPAQGEEVNIQIASNGPSFNYLPSINKEHISPKGSQPQANHAPNAPECQTPQVGDVEQPLDIELQWKANDPDGDILRYDVYFDTSYPPAIVADNISGNTLYFADILEGNTLYYWRVVARDQHGLETSGPICDFNTEERVATPTPQPTTHIWYSEAETGQLQQPIGLGTSTSASSCQYIYTIDDWSHGSVSFTFSVPKSGYYYPWTRSMGLGWNQNSFFVAFDSKNEFHFEVMPIDEDGIVTWDWQWQRLNSDQTTENRWWLSEGTHTLKFRSREGNARLDSILLTAEESYIPSQVVDCNQ